MNALELLKILNDYEILTLVSYESFNHYNNLLVRDKKINK